MARRRLRHRRCAVAQRVSRPDRLGTDAAEHRRRRQADPLWCAYACSGCDHHGDVPRRVQRPAERPWHLAAGDWQHHHLHSGDCVRQSGRVGPGARLHASGSRHALLRE